VSELRIIEVGPRDGLQNEPTPIPLEVKARFIANLIEAGAKEIEVTSFVHPKWVPQLADADELLATIPRPEGVHFSALVPNRRGLDRALASGVNRIALFTAASEAFTTKNINMTIAESLAEFRAVADAFREAVPNAFIRGYVSTVVECPFAGPVAPSQVKEVIDHLIQIGVDEISLGDTIGVAIPDDIQRLADALEPALSPSQTAWHFHDTRGTAMANVAAMVERGYRAFDASAGGLGGCPYAPGAGGNLATEDLIYYLERKGLATGWDLDRLVQAGSEVFAHLNRPSASRVHQAVLAACR